jgi:DNA-binding CsgD family transcriptional regulator
MPLLEREPLLEQLRAGLAAVRGGSGRLVLVTGEAGIGKTAVINAFAAQLPRGTTTLRGACDPVVPARPFAPIADMAAQVGGGLQTALLRADREAVFDRFLAVLRALPSGSVITIEDLHWADAATLDLLRILGRRLAETRVLIVGTYRGHEIDAGHPLRLAFGDLPPSLVTEVAVPPLTAVAVRALASGTGLDPTQLHQATAGNPFFVTEVVAGGGTALPTSVRDAVGARVGRLSPEAQSVLRAVAVLGERAEHLLIATVADVVAPAALDECLARGMLQRNGDEVTFRHELARRAVLDGIPIDERRSLHRRALRALHAGVVAPDPVRLGRHAIESGDADAIVDAAPPAAERAAGLGAHREAADFLALALAFPDEFDDRGRADLLERYANECSLSDRVAAARTAQEAALTVWRALGDRVREGNGLRAMSMYMWQSGEGDRARDVALEAVETLEPVAPESHELANAFAKLAQLTLNSGRDDVAARRWGTRAHELAERIGDEPIAVHAMLTLALATVYMDGSIDVAMLEEALGRARAADLHEDTIRSLINLVETGRDMRRYDIADRYIAESVAFLREHEFELYRLHLRSRIAQVSLEEGRWDAAELDARSVVAGTSGSSQARVHALEVLGRLGARRGSGDAWSFLDQALAITGPGEHQELFPLRAARAEAAWLDGDLVQAGDEAMAALRLAEPSEPAYWYSDLSFWAWRAGRIDGPPAGSEPAYALHAAGEYRASAEAWARIGCPYERAAALADSDDEADLRDALAVLQPLGAHVLADRVKERLRNLGARQIPRGPRRSTVANPAGLSSREMDVLALIRTGARNADIADQLVISKKTVDHHVSAILKKLGVPNREAARREAARFDLEDGEPARPT